MTSQTLSKIFILVVSITLTAGGILAYQYFKVWEKEVKILPEIPKVTEELIEETVSDGRTEKITPSPEEELPKEKEKVPPEEKIEALNVGVVIFKYIDTILPDFIYCRWPNGDRWFYLDECKDVNRPGQKAEILTEYAALDLITDLKDRRKVFSYGKENYWYIYSLYYLADYFDNEATKYGIDFKTTLHPYGPFNLTELLPPTKERVTAGYLLTDYSFFINQAKKRLDTSSFDKLIIVFLNDADFQDRESSFSFTSVALPQSGIAILNFRLGTDLINSGEFMKTLSHEFQHVLGASDLYIEPCPRGPYWNCCMEPEGIPEPNKIPKYPQTKSCSMCGQKMLTSDGMGQSATLEETIICSKTMEEMGWE